MPGIPQRAAAAAACLAACGPIVREPPYPARPDTVRPAQLLGAHEGQVVDGETGAPLADALIGASWRFERGLGAAGPAGGVLRETHTDADGRYRVEPPDELPAGLSSAVAGFTLIVYKKGYVGWRSDRAPQDRGPRARRDFAQRGARVELRRLAPGEPVAAAVAHLGVWGSPPSIAAALAGDLAAAAAAREAPREAGAAPRLDAGRLLLPEDVRAETGYAGGFEARKMRDPPTTATSDSHHLRAVEAPERFDAALRIWRPANGAEAEAQYQRLLRTYPGAVARDEIGDRSFRAAEGEILAVGLLDRAAGLVAAFTCGVGLCPDHDVVLRLARRALERARPAGQPQ